MNRQQDSNYDQIVINNLENDIKDIYDIVKWEIAFTAFPKLKKIFEKHGLLN